MGDHGDDRGRRQLRRRRTPERSGVEAQRAYFAVAANRYPRASVLRPPAHTVLEVEAVLERLASLGAGEPVADFGAGTGRLTVPLVAAGYQVLAVDVSEPSLDVLRGIARELELSGVETGAALPRDGSLAAVVGADVLHHVDLDTSLPEIRDSLRAGGRAVFSEPGALNPAWYPFLLLRRDLRVERRIVYGNTWTLRRAFERNGFRDVRITGLGILPRVLFRSRPSACRHNDAAGGLPLLRWFAYRYVVQARRG